MDVQPLLPGTEALVCEQVSINSGQVVLQVHASSKSACCPDCHRASERVHSRYRRILADLPWQGKPACLHVLVRRFFCDNQPCRRKTFAERLPEVTAVRSRQTQRLGEAHQSIALANGGEAGSRLAGRLGMPTSPDTLLRGLRRLPDPPQAPPRIIGVDDWALRRGQRYGTIVCDLQHHRPIDLLPGRSTQAVRDWLGEHPSVRLISRDRGETYRKAATDGAPQAVQVADRWHLLHNLHEAVMREVDRHDRQVLEAAKAARTEHVSPTPFVPAVAAPPTARKPTRADQLKHVRRARRMRRYEQVMQLHRQGMSLRSIARQVGMNRGTVRRYVRAGGFPERAERPSRSGADSFTAHLRQRWEAGCTNAAALFRELQGMGFKGSYHTVRRKVGHWRDPTQCTRTGGPKPGRGAGKLHRPSPRRVAWLLLKGQVGLEPEDRWLRRKVRAHCPTLKTAAALGRWFARLVRQRQHDKLGAWLDRAGADNAPMAVRGFAHGLLEDLPAVRAALSQPWSNGQVEGQINRLKLVKRQMYGRANFDLLRVRFLHAA